ncbi:MAG TPA: hypothetical protein DCS48_04915 [Desulfovibrio sp.]|nr:hypothetical protein [Desulfovibrio sp.]
MNKKLKILHLLCLFLLSAGYVKAEMKTISLSTGEWPPYVSEHLHANGVVSELITKIFKSVEIKAESNFYPWNRALLSVKKGGDEGSYPWRKQPDREEFGAFSDVIISTDMTFIYYKKHFKGKEFRDPLEVKPYVVGVPFGYAQGEDLRKLGYRCQSIPSSANGIFMLMKGNISFLIETRAVAMYLIRQHLAEHEAEFGTLHSGFPPLLLRLMISKKIPEYKILLERFNKGLARFKASGEYDRIMNRHGFAVYGQNK